MNTSTDMNNQNNNESRYSNKDQGKGFALFGYGVLMLGVVASVVLVLLFG